MKKDCFNHRNFKLIFKFYLPIGFLGNSAVMLQSQTMLIFCILGFCQRTPSQIKRHIINSFKRYTAYIDYVLMSSVNDYMYKQ